MKNKKTQIRKKAMGCNNNVKDNYNVGGRIYLPTELYLSHGEDDFDGGLCKIIEIGNDSGWKWLRVEENPEKQYGLAYVIENQEKWKKEYGNARGKRNPDYDIEFNCWATPGDIVDGQKIDYYIP